MWGNVNTLFSAKDTAPPLIVLTRNCVISRQIRSHLRKNSNEIRDMRLVDLCGAERLHPPNEANSYVKRGGKIGLDFRIEGITA